MKNWKTNIIGAILIITGIAMYIKTQDFTQPGLCLTAGAGFFLSKDHNVTGQ